MAVYEGGQGLLAHALHSQVAVHAEFGGVVPELASRDHVRKTLPLLRRVLSEAGLAGTDIDGVAYTAGPGLVGALPSLPEQPRRPIDADDRSAANMALYEGEVLPRPACDVEHTIPSGYVECFYDRRSRLSIPFF